MDRTDARSLRRDVSPYTEALEDAAAGIAQRGGAIVKARLRTRARRDTLDEHYVDTKSPQRKRETRANHPSTDNRDIDFHRGSPRRHESFDLIDTLRRTRGEHFRPRLRHHHVVLNADADVVKALWDSAAARRNVNAGLDGHHHPGL